MSMKIQFSASFPSPVPAGIGMPCQHGSGRFRRRLGKIAAKRANDRFFGLKVRHRMNLHFGRVTVQRNPAANLLQAYSLLLRCRGGVPGQTGPRWMQNTGFSRIAPASKDGSASDRIAFIHRSIASTGNRLGHRHHRPAFGEVPAVFGVARLRWQGDSDATALAETITGLDKTGVLHRR